MFKNNPLLSLLTLGLLGGTPPAPKVGKKIVRIGGDTAPPSLPVHSYSNSLMPDLQLGPAIRGGCPPPWATRPNRSAAKQRKVRKRLRYSRH